jgi:ubiquinone/menaquinone biosynthesis C-methylase UbiE
MITIDLRRFLGDDPALSSGFRLLDVGCGTGRHLGAAVRYQDIQAVGIDHSIGDLAEAKRRLVFQRDLGECPGRFQVLASDIFRLPFRDESFDGVICSEVLEHIKDPRPAVSEILRLLKPGGSLAASVPRHLPERICWALSAEYHRRPGGHVRIYRKKELVGMLESAGLLYRTTSHYAHSLHTPFWWLKCLVGPERDDFRPVQLYHRFLVWDMMKRPALTRTLERLLDPILGKSLVVYFRKPFVKET